MYVGVPKNYGGTAFPRERSEQPPRRPAVPPTLPQVMPPTEKPPNDGRHCDERRLDERNCDEKSCCEPRREETRCDEPRRGGHPCNDCRADDKNPFSCILNAFRRGKNDGITPEDFLLLGLIALLIGKEGNEDIVLILVMLLLI